VLEFLRTSAEDPAVAEFLAALPKDGQTAITGALATVAEDAAFRTSLATTRNLAFHYPRVGEKVLRRALSALATREAELQLGRGLARYRALYADEVAVQLFSPSGDVSPDDFRRFITQVRDLTVQLMIGLQVVLATYFSGPASGQLRPIP
jgi:hypothetical protein